MEKLKLFFWNCSGAHVEFLKKCPSESSKYVGIGATIFFTGIFAAFAGGYALYTVFDSWWIATLLGLIWGFMIFNLDRYIVSSMRKEGNTSREIKMALPRIILAILISIVIAKPLEMKIFDKEIRSELVIIEEEIRTTQENEVKARYQPDQERLKNDIATIQQEVTKKTAHRDDLIRQAQEEADGTGGTKQRNAGPVYKIKKANADRLDKELQELSQKTGTLIQKKLTELAYYDSLSLAEINTITKDKLDGPAMRMEALDRLTNQSSAIYWANLFIMLLFIAIETAPVFVKLLSPRGPYDYLLKSEEHNFETQCIKTVGETNATIKAQTEPLSQIEKDYIKDKLDLTLNKG